jgi:hypothetical protein
MVILMVLWKKNVLNRVFAISVGASLMHAAIETGLADWTGLCCVFESVRSIEGILLVPSHDSGAWVSGCQMSVVV